MIKASELVEKEVVSLTDGRKIGMISDLEVDLKTGKINGIIIPGGERFMSFFGKEEEYEISWGEIKKIGADVILVEVKNTIDVSKKSPLIDIEENE